MKKILLVLSVLVFLVGLTDWLAGFPVHGQQLMICSAIGLVIALAVHLRQKLQKPKAPLVRVLVTVALCGVTDACAAEMQEIHKVLIPPDVTPMIQRSLVAGSENWVWALLIAVGIGLFYWGLVRFLQGCSWYNRPRCN